MASKKVQILSGLVIALFVIVPMAIRPADAQPGPYTTKLPTVDPASLASALDWQPCPTETNDRLQCAKMPVPLDYAQPSGEQISLSLIRLPAADQENRVGSVVYNPGGPGVPGIESVQIRLPDDPLTDRLDLVSFDPRGVGESSPVECLDIAELRVGVPAFPTPEANRDEAISNAKEFADACLANSGDLLSFLSTLNVAYDMDVLRESLGDEKLTYLGSSYGTYLGATYASVFPERVRGMVLDGAVDAVQYANDPLGQYPDFANAFQTAIDRWFDYCLTECAFNGNQDPDTAFTDLVHRFDTDPLPAGPAPGARPTTGADLITAAQTVAYDRGTLWPVFDDALTALQQGDGSIIASLVDATFGNAGLAASNIAINCLDRAYPKNLEPYDNLYRELTDRSPLFGPTAWFNTYLQSAACPAKANVRFDGPFQYDNPEGVPIVVIGTTFDPATPYEDAKTLTDTLGNATLLTMRGDGHTAFELGSRCIDRQVIAYLTDLTPPATLVCTQQFTPPDASE